MVCVDYTQIFKKQSGLVSAPKLHSVCVRTLIVTHSTNGSAGSVAFRLLTAQKCKLDLQNPLVKGAIQLCDVVLQSP